MITLIALAAILTPLSMADQIPLQGAGCTVVANQKVLLITDYSNAVVRIDGRKMQLSTRGIFDLQRNDAFLGHGVRITIKANGRSINDEDNETQDTVVSVVISLPGKTSTLSGKLSCYA